jgi:hypothetical protein
VTGPKLRANGLPLMVVVKTELVPFGENGGRAQVCTLSCGHTVMHLGGHQKRIGMRTGCERCR